MCLYCRRLPEKWTNTNNIICQTCIPDQFTASKVEPGEIINEREHMLEDLRNTFNTIIIDLSKHLFLNLVIFKFHIC